MITKLIDHETGESGDDWLKLRSLIVPAFIEKNEDLVDDDRYFSNKDEDKYKYKIPIFRQNSSE